MSVRLEEELFESYEDICEDNDLSKSDPVRRFVNELVGDAEFRDFYFDEWEEEGSFEQALTDHSETVAQSDEMKRGAVELESGLSRRYEDLAYSGAGKIRDANESIGRPIEAALDAIDSSYWEL